MRTDGMGSVGYAPMSTLVASDEEIFKLKMYGQSLIPVYLDSEIRKITNKETPLPQLMPRNTYKLEKQRSTSQKIVSRIKRTLIRIRLRLARAIGGQALEDEFYNENDY